MTNNPRKMVPRGRLAFRGDDYEIVWEPEMPELDPDYKASKTEGQWLCVEKVPPWERVEIEGPLFWDRYDPFKDVPNLYLAFAGLGTTAWDLYRRHIGLNEVQSEGLNSKVAEQVIDFHNRYGAPMVATGDSDHVSVPRILRSAQDIDVVVTYLRCRSGDKAIEELRDRMRLIKDGDYLWPVTVASDEDVYESAEGFIKWVQKEETNLGGLETHAERIEPIDVPADWVIVPSFESLLNVIWFQAVNALVRNSLVKECPNETCLLPGRFFVADRPNQIHCSTSCRGQKNTRTWRTRQTPTQVRHRSKAKEE